MIEIIAKEYEKKLNWNDGMLYCSLLVIDGVDDWRMPTIEELDYIYNNENDFDGSDYWSSIEGHGKLAWYQTMPGVGRDTASKSCMLYVRAVRSIKYEY